MDKKLKSKLSEADVVSFDVFDTSILRALARPEDLFLLMEPAVRRRLGRLSLDFAAARRTAERLARERVWEKERLPEVSLEEIYSALAESIELDPAQAREIIEMEIAAELDVCRQNPFIHELYRWCLDRGKRVAFISDTYLPETVIADILRDAGYGRYEVLLASSTSRRTKSSGELYSVARSRLGAGSKWLHVGDNLDADIKMARTHGLSTWYYRRCADAFLDGQHVADAWAPATASAGNSVAQGLVANRVAQDRAASAAMQQGFWEDLGYATAGPLLVGFAEWLIAQSKLRRLDALYFLAREGVIMQRVYDRLAAGEEGAATETHYLYGSRRVLNIAAIRQLNDDVMAFLCGGTSVLTPAQFVERAGANWREHLDAFRAAGFDDPHKEVRTGTDYAGLRRLFAALEGPICANATEEREVLLEYLGAIGLTAGRNVGLVDVGWHGTMQRSLTNILRDAGPSPQIAGLYIGTFASALKHNLIDDSFPHDGYLFRGGEPDAYCRLIGEGVAVVELLFAAAEGTVIRIEREAGGGFRPVRATNDLEPNRIDGILGMHAGVMQFVEDYLTLKSHFPELALTRDAAVAQLKRLLRHPTAAEACNIGDIPHGEGFGAVYARRLLASPHSLWMLARPKEFRAILNSDYWQAGRNRRSSPIQRAVYWLLT
jgi:predicted HAD superfamily hydrolase